MKKLKAAIKAFLMTLKHGGYSEIKISNIQYETLLQGKNVIITGGGSGIGLAIAKKFISMGAEVLIIGRNEEKLQKVCKEINHPHIHYIVWDIANVKNIDENLCKIINKFRGRIDVLINNAGVQPNEFFPNVSEVEWEKIYNTNSKGTFFMSQAICNYWMKYPNPNYSKIINISSQGGFVGAVYPYRMSKWDICGLTQGLALRMAKYGVLVNGIAPGVVKTEMQKFSLEQGENTFCSQNPLKRVSLPEEIAEIAAFMASDACNFMCGQTILIDGGFSLK